MVWKRSHDPPAPPPLLAHRASADGGTMNHGELVERAASWLLNTRRCGVVITEMGSSSPEHPDAIGWNGLESTVVECKASRADFRADAGKWHRRLTGDSMGTQRYFLAVSGLIKLEELPEGWGLLEIRGSRVFITGSAVRTPVSSRAFEVQLLTSALRRMVGPQTTGIRCRVHQHVGTGDPRATLAVIMSEGTEREA